MKKGEIQIQEVSPDEPYFKLIEAVGSNGPYQWLIICCCVVFSFQQGLMVLSSPYYFAVAPYTNCPEPHRDPTSCNQYVCSLPPSQRNRFQQSQISQLKTLGNEFGDYRCEQSETLSSAKGIYFIGSIGGDVLSGSIADNLGRRPLFLLSGAISILGHLIILLAQDIRVLSAGLFIAGIGLEASFNVSIMVLSEILQNKRRQKMLSFFQAFYPMAGLAAIAAFYFIKNWRPIFLYLCFVPLTLVLLLIFLVLQETPQYLIKNHRVDEIRSSLLFVARMNNRVSSFEEEHAVSVQHLSAFKQEYIQEMSHEHKRVFSFLDLFRFPSLRTTTICVSLVFLACNFLYLAPNMILDQFGFDFYLNGIVVNTSELITYVFSYYLITQIPRRQFGLLSFSIVLLSCFALIFLQGKEICTENCFTWKVVIVMVIIFIMRFFFTFYYQLLYVYMTELFPVQIVGSALGLSIVIGSSINPFTPQLLDTVKKTNFPVMAIFCLFSCLGLLGIYFLEETHGRPPIDRVEQIHHQEGHQEFLEDES